MKRILREHESEKKPVGINHTFKDGIHHLFICAKPIIQKCIAHIRAFKWPYVGFVVVIILVCLVRNCVSGYDSDSDSDSGAVVFKVSKNFRYFNNYRIVFNDLNPKHIAAAKKNGVPPMESLEQVEKCRYKLKKVTDTRYYKVDKLTHSVPYLVPKALDMLDDIGENFRDSLNSKDIPSCRLIVTSVLRTDGLVKKLQRSNGNASSNSAHRYGTTIDIAYRRFDDGEGVHPDVYKTVLAEVLRDLRAKGRCYVRYEANQSCFHITVR